MPIQQRNLNLPLLIIILKLSKKEKKVLRGKLKTVTLGLMYGLGKQSLAARLFCSVEEAQELIDVFFKAYPRVKDYIREQGEYVFTHDGYVNSLSEDSIKSGNLFTCFAKYLSKI